MARIPLGCEAVAGSLTPSKKREYRVTNRLQEGKRPIYAVVFNFIDSRYFNAFATAGGNRVLLLSLSLYLCDFFEFVMQMRRIGGDCVSGDCLPVSGGWCYSCAAILHWWRCNLIQTPNLSIFWAFGPRDSCSQTVLCCCVCCVDQKDESFYTVSWACNIDGTPFLVAGGVNGIIRVIDTGSEKIYKVVLLTTTYESSMVNMCILVDLMLYFWLIHFLLLTFLDHMWLYLGEEFVEEANAML